MKVRQVQDPGT